LIARSTLIGHSALVHQGRRTSVWQTRVATDGAKLVALGTQTQMTL
jgi:acyl-coenzyme A thioesterase PaaI-like protein